jgi:TMEM175 potassium channel family protein
MNKGRLEAFSDGVLAVAITLLVLDLHLDASAGHESVPTQLRHEWPSFAAYLVSFFFIGVIWVNHNALLTLAARADRVLLFYNLMLLMWVTTIPFTTSTFAAFLREGGGDARWAVVLYGVAIEGMSISFVLILWRMITHNLLVRPVDPAVGRKAVLRFGLGTLAYPVAVVIGLLSPPAMLLAFVALAAYYMIEHTAILPAPAEDGVA